MPLILLQTSEHLKPAVIRLPASPVSWPDFYLIWEFLSLLASASLWFLPPIHVEGSHCPTKTNQMDHCFCFKFLSLGNPSPCQTPLVYLCLKREAGLWGHCSWVKDTDELWWVGWWEGLENYVSYSHIWHNSHHYKSSANLHNKYLWHTYLVLERLHSRPWKYKGTIQTWTLDVWTREDRMDIHLENMLGVMAHIL